MRQTFDWHIVCKYTYFFPQCYNFFSQQITEMWSCLIYWNASACTELRYKHNMLRYFTNMINHDSQLLLVCIIDGGLIMYDQIAAQLPNDSDLNVAKSWFSAHKHLTSPFSTWATETTAQTTLSYVINHLIIPSIAVRKWFRKVVRKHVQSCRLPKSAESVKYILIMLMPGSEIGYFAVKWCLWLFSFT